MTTLSRLSPTPAARLRRECDALWSKCIAKLFKGRCARCGSAGYHAHHLIKRRNKHTRWAIMNGIFLCITCHNIAETNPYVFEGWLKIYAEEHYSWMKEYGREAGTVLVCEMKETRDMLKQVLRRLA
jgi:hypothetical protein